MHLMPNATLAIAAFPIKEFISQLLTFTYSLAHYLGKFVIYLFGEIVPQYSLHQELADPIGFLAVLTGFLILYKIAQKVAWGMLLVAWIFAVIRVVIVLFE